MVLTDTTEDTRYTRVCDTIGHGPIHLRGDRGWGIGERLSRIYGSEGVLGLHGFLGERVAFREFSELCLGAMEEGGDGAWRYLQDIAHLVVRPMLKVGEYDDIAILYGEEGEDFLDILGEILLAKVVLGIMGARDELDRVTDRVVVHGAGILGVTLARAVVVDDGIVRDAVYP